MNNENQSSVIISIKDMLSYGRSVQLHTVQIRYHRWMENPITRGTRRIEMRVLSIMLTGAICIWPEEIKLECQCQGAITLITHQTMSSMNDFICLYFFYTWLGQIFQLWRFSTSTASQPQGTIFSWKCILHWYLVECCIYTYFSVGDQKLRWGIMAFLWYHNGYYSPQ